MHVCVLILLPLKQQLQKEFHKNGFQLRYLETEDAEQKNQRFDDS